MRTIKLTQGQVTKVSDEDYEELNQFKWFAKETPNGQYYAMRSVRLKNGKQGKLTMARHILGCEKGDGMVTDHIDGEKLDNRRSNIRVCTQAQNVQNSRMQSNNTSGAKGVCRNGRKWMAYIGFHGKHGTIGRFKNVLDAARAYDARALELFGQFALTNAMLGLYKGVN